MQFPNEWLDQRHVPHKFSFNLHKTFSMQILPLNVVLLLCIWMPHQRIHCTKRITILLYSFHIQATVIHLLNSILNIILHTSMQIPMHSVDKSTKSFLQFPFAPSLQVQNSKRSFSLDLCSLICLLCVIVCLNFNKLQIKLWYT